MSNKKWQLLTNAETEFPSKKKVDATAKKKTVSTSKTLELSNQGLHAIVMKAFKGKRIAYFVLDTERSKDGAFLLCVAVQGDGGFIRMNCEWNCSYSMAKVKAKEMNILLGLTPEEVTKIVLSTIKPPV